MDLPHIQGQGVGRVSMPDLHFALCSRCLEQGEVYNWQELLNCAVCLLQTSLFWLDLANSWLRRYHYMLCRNCSGFLLYSISEICMKS